ncbi:MAG: DNA-3-methyladenine glycosylase [Microgenomates group bacterium]
MENTQAVSHLRKDKVLNLIIDKYKVSSPKISVNLFQDLLESIISQQLSNKAATTIFNRFLSLFPKEQVPQPEEILKLNEETLRSCGVSHQKASYLKSLAEEIASQKLVLDNLHLLEDEEVILELTKVKGIGRWTAEMFLIFSLGRQNIFSVGDLGLRSAVAKLYGVNREDKIKIEEISKSWSPYRSLASLYLWKSLENS